MILQLKASWKEMVSFEGNASWATILRRGNMALESVLDYFLFNHSCSQFECQETFEGLLLFEADLPRHSHTGHWEWIPFELRSFATPPFKPIAWQFVGFLVCRFGKGERTIQLSRFILGKSLDLWDRCLFGFPCKPLGIKLSISRLTLDLRRRALRRT